jgi:hypothetical protein
LGGTDLEQVFRSVTQNVGPAHAFTLSTKNNLATAYMGADQNADTIELLAQAMPVIAKNDGLDQLSSLAALINLAGACRGMLRHNSSVPEEDHDGDARPEIQGISGAP